MITAIPNSAAIAAITPSSSELPSLPSSELALSSDLPSLLTLSKQLLLSFELLVVTIAIENGNV